MDELIGLLILLAIGLAAAGPVAVILAIVLFNKVGSLERRISRIKVKGYEPPMQPAPKPAPVPIPQPVMEEAPVPTPKPEPPKPEPPCPPVESRRPEAAVQPAPSQPIPPTPVGPAPANSPAPMDFSAIAKKPKKQDSQMEVKIGVTVALIVGVITVIIGVAFFLKYMVENMTFPPTARVCMVAVGGLAALVIGEILRRREYEIVAKGIAALGFVLLFGAVIGGHKVYGLFDTSWAYAGAVVIIAAAMLYAVGLNEKLIAFLSLLGGYLTPIIISTGRNLPIHLFGYVLVLSAGAMAAAAFRRWRAVNWMAFAGTYILYTLWFEKFYADDQLTVALVWLGIFGGLYLLLPMMHGLMQKLKARSEDVSLIVANSIIVFYYLWRMLYADYQQELGLTVGAIGLVHLVMAVVVRVRCKDDINLHAVLGVLGTGLVTAGIGLYFARLHPALLGWAIEAAVLAFVAVRYRTLWPQVMSIIVAGIATAWLFYHLPLHTSEDFRVFLNEPFGTWLFVALAILVCHAFWRFLRSEEDDEAGLMMQVYYVWGRLLLAVGVTLEWYNHCAWHIEFVKQEQAFMLMGMMVIASILTLGFFLRPLCPRGGFVRIVGVMTAVAGSVFVAMALMGVYYQPFRIFVNLPFGLAMVFAAVLFFAAWQVRRAVADNHPHRQIPPAMVVMGLILLFVMLSEQIYSYWYCRHEYGLERIGDWQATAHRFMFITWAVYGLALLAAGIRFDKMAIKTLGMLASGFSAAGLFLHLPLHNKGDFNFVFNLPFITWVCVAAALLMGHALWRFMRPAKENENPPGSQIYYTAGGLLLALGCLFEWYAHCNWQVDSGDVGRANFIMGSILIGIVLVLSFLARPLPPAGLLVKTAGLLVAVAGAIWTAYGMNEVYYQAFTVFANIPFVIAMLYVFTLLLAGRLLKQTDSPNAGKLSAAMVLAGLVLLWVLLSEQIYQFWYCAHQYGSADANWRFRAQMYISMTWAMYAAVLLVIGFGFRARSIRYLALVILAVLLGKIFIVDTATLRTEYRIAAFLTTGLVLVGVSFLYQFLKKKGFFDAIDKQAINHELPEDVKTS